MKKVFVLLLIIFGLFFSALVFASSTNGTIDAINKYAWSNNAGWVNFGATNGNVAITDSGITGYAWNETYGWINMNPTQSGVSVANGGALSGYAWGEGLGWVNFSGTSINCSGEFSGSATGDAVGTLTFDCTNCSVTTDYRPVDCRTSPSCGDGACNGSENCSSCSVDCGLCGTSSRTVCDTTTHRCVLVSGGGEDECDVIDSLCCDPHGDLNWSGVINGQDLSILLTNWRQTVNWTRTPHISPPYNECADITHASPALTLPIGTVNGQDFSIMLTYWGRK